MGKFLVTWKDNCHHLEDPSAHPRPHQALLPPAPHPGCLQARSWGRWSCSLPRSGSRRKPEPRSGSHFCCLWLCLMWRVAAVARLHIKRIQFQIRAFSFNMNKVLASKVLLLEYLKTPQYIIPNLTQSNHSIQSYVLYALNLWWAVGTTLSCIFNVRDF